MGGFHDQYGNYRPDLVADAQKVEIDRLRDELAKYEAAGKGLLPDCEPVAGAGVCAAFQFARAALGKVGAELAAKDARIAETERCRNNAENALEAANARIAELEGAIEINKVGVKNLRARAERAEAELDISREAHRMVQSALLSQAAETERAEAERDALRKNFAKYLVPAYRAFPLETARTCDEELDQSGALLGYVRDAARAALAPSPSGRVVSHEEGARMIQEPELDDSVIVHEDGSISSPAGREG